MKNTIKRSAALLLALTIACSLFLTAVPVFADSEEDAPVPKNGISTIAQLDGKNIGVQTGVLHAIQDHSCLLLFVVDL